jgi:ketosteroid isomerase-like protein
MPETQAETEIRSVITAITAALQKADSAALDKLMSDRPGCVNIGSDPDEWWDKAQMLAGFTDALTVDDAAVRIELGEISVHVQGDVGWSEGTGKFVAADGAECPFRTTGVFVYEGGAWRLAQLHTSVGVPNADMFRR